jgi:hypothetical protein
VFNHRTGYFFGSAAKFWWVFIAVGLFALASPYMLTLDISTLRTVLVGLVAITLGLVLRLHYFGLQIDIGKKQIRDYITILGIKRGKWRPIPHIRKITFTSAKVSSWNTPNGISPTFKSNVTAYTIGLFTHGVSPEFLIQTENKHVASTRAAQLSELFGIEIDFLK